MLLDFHIVVLCIWEAFYPGKCSLQLDLKLGFMLEPCTHFLCFLFLLFLIDTLLLFLWQTCRH